VYSSAEKIKYRYKNPVENSSLFVVSFRDKTDAKNNRKRKSCL
jgi:hypothetical protein